MKKQREQESAPQAAVPAPRQAPTRHGTSASSGVQPPGRLPETLVVLPAQLLSLQRLAGNAAVERLVRSTRAPARTVQRQPKPTAAPPPLPKPTAAPPQDTATIRQSVLEPLPVL